MLSPRLYQNVYQFICGKTPGNRAVFSFATPPNYSVCRAPGLFPALETVTEEAFADILKSHASDVPILAFAEENVSWMEYFKLVSGLTALVM